MHALTMLTDVGDCLLLGVCATVGAAVLLWFRSRWEAGVLILGYLASGAVIAALKVLCMGCHDLVPWLDAHSPSGHAALSAGTMGTAAMLIAGRLDGTARVIWPLMAVALAAGIAVSRVVLGMHTVWEVALGLACGFGVAVAVQFLPGGGTRPAVGVWGLLVPVAAAMVLVYGVRAPAEGFIRQIAAMVHVSVSVCKAEA